MVIGATHTLLRRVTEADVASNLYPGLGQPSVLATARLMQWCELAAMHQLGGCYLSTSVQLSHVAPAVLETLLSIVAECTNVHEFRSSWRVTVQDENRLIGRATVEFVRIDSRLTTSLTPGGRRAGHLG